MLTSAHLTKGLVIVLFALTTCGLASAQPVILTRRRWTLWASNDVGTE